MINRHPYITATLIATLLAIVVWLSMPKEYTAVTKLSDEYKEMDLAIGLDDLKAHIKKVMGNANNGMNDMEVYCKVLKTEDFARSIAHKHVHGKKMTYGEYLGKKDTIAAVLNNINYNYSNRHVTLTIGFNDRDPLVAAQMLDSVTAHLQEVVTHNRYIIAEAAFRNAKKELDSTFTDYHIAQKAYTYDKKHLCNVPLLPLQQFSQTQSPKSTASHLPVYFLQLSFYHSLQLKGFSSIRKKNLLYIIWILGIYSLLGT